MAAAEGRRSASSFRRISRRATGSMPFVCDATSCRGRVACDRRHAPVAARREHFAGQRLGALGRQDFARRYRSIRPSRVTCIPWVGAAAFVPSATLALHPMFSYARVGASRSSSAINFDAYRLVPRSPRARARRAKRLGSALSVLVSAIARADIGAFAPRLPRQSAGLTWLDGNGLPERGLSIAATVFVGGPDCRGAVRAFIASRDLNSSAFASAPSVRPLFAPATSIVVARAFLRAATPSDRASLDDRPIPRTDCPHLPITSPQFALSCSPPRVLAVWAAA